MSALIVPALILPIAFMAIARNRKEMKSALTAFIASLVSLETMGILHRLEIIYIDRFAQVITMTLIIDIVLLIAAVAYGYICTKPKKGESDDYFNRFMMVKNIVSYTLMGIIVAIMLIIIIRPKTNDADILKDGQKVVITPVSDEMSAITVYDRLDIHLGEKRYKEQQIFLLKEVEDGYFNIEAYNEENVLDIYDNRYEKGTPVIEWFNLDADNQKWKLVHDKKGYAIYSKAVNELYMSMADDNKSIVMSDMTGEDNLYFNIEVVSNWEALMSLGNKKAECVIMLFIAVIVSAAAVVINKGLFWK